MLTSSNLKKVTLTSIAIVTCSIGQNTFAHTEIQSGGSMASSINVPAEGSGLVYNNIVIGHGCEDPKNANHQFPVIAESVVFPTVNPIVTTGSGAGTVSTKTIGDLLLTSATDTTPLPTLANFAQLIQSKDIFSAQKEKFDTANTNVIGFEGIKGNLNPTLQGLIPFTTSSLFFNPKACIKQLNIKVAIADICKLTFKTGKNSGPVAGAANTWFPNKTPKFTQNLDGVTDDSGAGAEIGSRAGEPATLTFVNTTTNDPDSDCVSGNTVEYTIWPSDEDIDKNIIIKNYWGK